MTSDVIVQTKVRKVKYDCVSLLKQELLAPVVKGLKADLYVIYGTNRRSR